MSSMNPDKHLPHSHYGSKVSHIVSQVHTHKYKCDKSTHHFHDLSTPLREQLQALQSKIKQLPVFRVGLLGLLTPWAGHHLQKWEKEVIINSK